MSRSPVSSQVSERVPMAEQRLPQTTAESAQEEEERQGTEDEEDDEDDQDRILEVYLGWQKLNQQVTRDVPGIDAAFLAMDTDDGVEVVWNEVIYSQNRRTGKSRDRLKKILQGLTEMKHQNIVTFHDFWHDKVGQQERLVFITEYITSGSLLQFLNKTKKTKKIVAVSDKIWRRWCRQILSALSYLHRNDITHGNLSLASIFIQHNGLVKIGSVSPDAIHTHVKTKQEVLKGLHYFAPEYTEGPITTHADIYSFGVCALEMLNLDLLGNGENFLALKDSIGKYVDALEPHKKQFVKLCLREDPKARPKANTLLKHPVLQEVFSLKLLSVFVLRERKNEIELKMDSLQFGDRPADSVLAFIPSKGGKPVQKVASEVCQIDIEKIFDDISQDLLLEPSVTTPKKSEPGTSSAHPASELSKDKTTPTYDRETRKVSFMVCEVRPITAENKCELWLKFNFDNKLERELSTELGAEDNAPDLASSLVEYGLVSEEDREKVVELINEKLHTMNSLLSPDNNNSFAET